MKHSCTQRQSDRLRQDTASMNIHCFSTVRDTVIHASLGLFFWLNVSHPVVLTLSMGG